MIRHNDLRELIWHSRSPFIRSLNVLRMSLIFGGSVRWALTWRGGTKVYIVFIIGRKAHHRTMSCLEGSLRITSKSKAPQGVFGRSRGRECRPRDRRVKKPRSSPSIRNCWAYLCDLTRHKLSSWRVILSVVSSPKADNEGWQEKKLKKAITTITFSETNLERTS